MGYFRAEAGVGEAARLLVAGLRAAGIPHALVPYAETVSRQSAPFEEQPVSSRFATNIVCVNADQLPRFFAEADPSLLDARYTIGMWWWEIEDFPEWMRPAADLLDEIWVGSRHAAGALARAVSAPVHHVPPPIIPPRPRIRARASLGLPEGFLFLFSFDFLSVLDRKNPLGVVEAFDRAFAPAEGPRLVIKTINGDHRPSDLERLQGLVEDRPDIVLVDGYVDQDTYHAVVAACDAYVSLHRAEGFGLTIAEAMALGKPAVATAYSGNLEFMDDENSYLVPYELVPIPPGCDPYPAGALWADPDTEVAATLMRRVYERRDEADLKARRAQADIAARHSPEARAALLRERLSAVEGRRSHARPGERRRKAVDLVEGAAESIERAPARRRAALLLSRRPDAASPPASWPVRVGRALVERGLRHYTHYWRLLDEALLEGIRDLERRVAALTAPPYTSSPSALRTTDTEGREAIGYRAQRSALASAEAYLGFEDVFRGSEPFIRERQRAYLPLLLSHDPVLDLGCGRGEMLDLLADAGVEAVGVDTDKAMVARCRMKGRRVEEAGAVAYLSSCPEGSLGAIFTSQFVEHLPYEQLLALLAEGRRALRPNGLLIAETVNPNSIPAFRTFWVDRTHVRPLFPETMVTLCRHFGFAEAVVRFPHGSGRLEDDRRMQGEYAVVARR